MMTTKTTTTTSATMLMRMIMIIVTTTMMMKERDKEINIRKMKSVFNKGDKLIIVLLLFFCNPVLMLQLKLLDYFCTKEARRAVVYIEANKQKTRTTSVIGLRYTNVSDEMYNSQHTEKPGKGTTFCKGTSVLLNSRLIGCWRPSAWCWRHRCLCTSQCFSAGQVEKTKITRFQHHLLNISFTDLPRSNYFR